MRDKLLVRLSPELKDLILNAVIRDCVEGGMGEYVVRVLAEHFGRPDLAKVPRQRMGRPPGPANGNGKKRQKAAV